MCLAAAHAKSSGETALPGGIRNYLLGALTYILRALAAKAEMGFVGCDCGSSRFQPFKELDLFLEAVNSPRALFSVRSFPRAGSAEIRIPRPLPLPLSLSLFLFLSLSLSLSLSLHVTPAKSPESPLAYHGMHLR